MEIHDLTRSDALDCKAMAAIHGAGGAPWVFGAFVPFAPASPALLPVVNNFFQQINVSETNFVATNLTLQSQNVNVQNSAANAVISISTPQTGLGISMPSSTQP